MPGLPALCDSGSRGTLWSYLCWLVYQTLFQCQPTWGSLERSIPPLGDVGKLLLPGIPRDWRALATEQGRGAPGSGHLGGKDMHQMRPPCLAQPRKRLSHFKEARRSEAKLGL